MVAKNLRMTELILDAFVLVVVFLFNLDSNFSFRFLIWVSLKGYAKSESHLYNCSDIPYTPLRNKELSFLPVQFS